MKIHVLNAMPIDGIGPSQTCLNICTAMAEHGAELTWFGTRMKAPTPRNVTMALPFSNLAARVPYRLSGSFLAAQMATRVRRAIPDGALVYVWPNTPLEMVEQLKARGCKIAYEMINITTRAEKRIIEAEMDRENFHYAHYVTDDKIAAQDRLFALADLIFCSNVNAEASLREAGIEPERIALTGYAASNFAERRSYDSAEPRFLFVGRVNLEKGAHLLLRAWHGAGCPGRLVLCGVPDPKFEAQYSDLLAHDSIEMAGFQTDMQRHYDRADCFILFSLAEGGPQVTHEATAKGVPVIASRMSAGRILDAPEALMLVDPNDVEAAAEAIRHLAQSPEARRRLGQAGHAISCQFTWSRAAQDRLGAIHALK